MKKCLMKKFCRLLLIPICVLSACTPIQENATEVAESTVLALVNDEAISQSDYELSETWLPDFVRETDARDTLNAYRFGALLQMVVMAQAAKTKGYMSDAEQSLIIKEAQAKLWLETLPLPEMDLSESAISQEIQAHPEKYGLPARFTVSFSLIHTETRRQALAAGYGLANGAQMGYNVVDPPPLEKSLYHTEGMPLLINQGGHPFDHDFFAFNFTTRFNEKKAETCRLGPFSANDGLIFSCDRAIQTLKTAPLYASLTSDISCDVEWKAFVIPEWREDARPMDADNAALHARQNLLEAARLKAQAAYVKSL